MNLRALVVDDEPLARERLCRLISKQPQVTLIGECGDGLTAVETILKTQPNLVFLDIQMPELDGFEVVRRLPSTARPCIVFVTAFDRYAVRAFEVEAMDYLLKPVDEERFLAALRRVQARNERGAQSEWNERLTRLLVELKPENKSVDRLAVKTDGRVLFLKFTELDWIEASDNYVEIHAGPNIHLLRETLASLNERLPSDQFLRISRSVIINVEHVRELQPLFHGEYSVILKDGTRVTLTRTYRGQLARLGLGKD